MYYNSGEWKRLGNFFSHSKPLFFMATKCRYLLCHSLHPSVCDQSSHKEQHFQGYHVPTPITKSCLLSRSRRLWSRSRNAALEALWLPALLPWDSSTPACDRVDPCAGWVEEGCSQAWGNMTELQEFPAAEQRTTGVVSGTERHFMVMNRGPLVKKNNLR